MVKKYFGILFTVSVVLAVILISVQTAFAMQLPGLSVTLRCTDFDYTEFGITADRNNTGSDSEAYRITITDGQGTILHLHQNLGGLPLGTYPPEAGQNGVGFNQGATALDNVRTYTWVSLAGNGFLEETAYTTTNPDCTSGAPVDSDGDGVPDVSDQCPGHDDNVDVDNDGTPDGCDSLIDSDGDGVADSADQCPGEDDTLDANTNGTPDCLETGPTDSDGDGVPDASDQCPGQDDTIDLNTNGIPDCAEGTNGGSNESSIDTDADDDGISNNRDNCPNAYNPGQEDGWGSMLGDACDTDWYNMRGIGISGFEQKSGDYHLHGNCIIMADGATRCPEVANFDPAAFTPDRMPAEVTTDSAGGWSVWVYFLYSSGGVDVYQVNVYTTNPPQPDTLIDDRLEIHVSGGSWQWYQRGGDKNYNGN